MSRCSRCGAAFTCAMADDKTTSPCWCTRLPPLPMPAPGAAASCYCPQCLRQAVDAAQQRAHSAEPHPE